MGCLERDSKILSERYINMRNLYQMGMTTNLDLLDKMKHLTPRMREEWMKNDLDALSAYVSLKEQYRSYPSFSSSLTSSGRNVPTSLTIPTA